MKCPGPAFLLSVAGLSLTGAGAAPGTAGTLSSEEISGQRGPVRERDTVRVSGRQYRDRREVKYYSSHVLETLGCC